MKSFPLSLVFSLACVASAQAATINATSCELNAVQSAMASAAPGDTVQVPPGTCSWSGGISISGITLLGPGKDAASPTHITGGTVTVRKHATQVTRLIGFRFDANSQHFEITGAVSARPFVIHDNRFFNDGARMGHMDTNGGLFSKNEFVAPAPLHGNIFPSQMPVGAGSSGLASWQAAPTMGVLDVTGEANTYFEDNVFSGFLDGLPDVDNGSRIVMRHNTFNDSTVVVHGGGSGSSGNDSSSYGGRFLEVYENTFNRVSNSASMNQWIWMRGSSGVFANNDVDNADSPDGSSYPNKPELRLSVGCPGSYPIQYQVGQSQSAAEAVPSWPYLVFGNTGYGVRSIIREGNPNNACASPSSYIQEGRDYFLTNSWGWAPYRYPHPLRASLPGGTAQIAPSPPASLVAQ